jgi:putative ABC transport system ATP-binding protein
MSGEASETGERNGEPAVRARALSRGFGAGDARVEAVRGVDLEIAPGRMEMIMGPSGCGKTTLLSLIAGVLKPDEGEAEVFGANWSELSGGELARTRGRHVGFVFQEFNLMPTITVLENAALPALIQGRSRSEAAERASETLDRMGLGDRLDATPDQLSGGMMQRVAIARALVADAPLLVCDEPTASLDAKTGGMVMETLRDVCGEEDDQGRRRTILAVTHDPRITSFADAIRDMEDGKLVGERAPETGEDSEGRS